MHGPRGTDEGEADLAAPVVLGHEPAFRIGALFVEPALRRVSRDGREEFIQPRVMQVLVALVRADGAILTRDDLIVSCWNGTIVSDDALNRIVSQVRKLAEGIGEGAFTVETVARVGYRLRSRDESSPATDAAQQVSALPQPHKRRQLAAWIWVALAALLAAAIGTGWWLVRPSAGSAMTLGLGRFEAIGAGLEPGLAASLDQELRTSLGDEELALTAGRSDLLLTGAARRVGDSLRLMARLEDTASGTTLWTRSQDSPAGDERALPEFARIAAEILQCGLEGARSHRRRLANAPFSLFLRYCDLDATSAPSMRSLDAARRVTAAAPDFASGWLARAWAVNVDAAESRAQGEALRREGMAAARRVIALEPEAEDGYAALATLLPPAEASQRESLLRRAIGLRPLLCACAHFYLGDFLIQSGRAEEALAMYVRAADRERGFLVLWRLAMAYRLTGRQRSADDTMRRIETLYPSRPGLRSTRRQMAAWNGQWAQAAELIRADRPDVQAALRDGMMALAAGDQAGIGRARQAIERMPASTDGEDFFASMLAAFGGTDSVLARLEFSRARGGFYAAPGRQPGIAQPFLFDPLLRPIWYDPRFPAFLERAGYLRYWRESGTPPDICRQPGAPPFCRLLARRSA